MIFYINTTLNQEIEIAIKDNGAILAQKKFNAPYQQAEKLLPAINELLKKNKIKWSQIREIEVENRGGSFTSLRIGVITANALGYALGIPVKGKGSKVKGQKCSFDIVEPIYDREPNITMKTK
ncbi:MAG: tRNA threonylcarbamoyladenosine biosynthesis protein TsaB [Patescibacteria group bacterium]|nr:tRNA threonylcarbamoyladenosine biosynthesis protein TsaB [Patescibacteria group bacterium]MDD4610954.1 tRNA threonylcarbamoyladenosine biosynthesis protein TsaB [Patescibacteria group bacterium]